MSVPDPEFGIKMVEIKVAEINAHKIRIKFHGALIRRRDVPGHVAAVS